MEKRNSGKNGIIAIIVDSIALITASFGSVISNFKIPALILGIITCIILIILLAKAYKIIGAIVGIVISVILMALMVIQVLISPSTGFSDKIDENTKIGTLELSAEELLMEYNSDDGSQRITSELIISDDLCEKVVLNSVDYDVSVQKYDLREGKIMFSDLPVGTYEIRLQLKGHSLYSGTFKLKENELSNGIWEKSVCIQTDEEYKEFEIMVADNEGEALKNYRCDLNISNTEYGIKNMISDEEGKLPYVFNMPNNLSFDLNLAYEDESYVNEYKVIDITNPLKAQFSTPPKGKIEVHETHQPDDVATQVYLPEWNTKEDMGIDGKRYGGGIKVTISDMFIGMGANSSKDVTSRITVPLDGDYEETIFRGVVVLDQTMYGVNSTGTISILVNNEIVFTTGEIGGDTVQAFPFAVDFGEADSLIILTEAHLSGSDFVYGFVSEE